MKMNQEFQATSRASSTYVFGRAGFAVGLFAAPLRLSLLATLVGSGSRWSPPATIPHAWGRRMIIVILLSGLFNHQVSGQKTHEIGLDVFSFRSGQPFMTERFNLRLLNGLSYKYHFGNKAIRTGVQYFNTTIEQSGDYFSTTKYREALGRIGFQYAFNDKPLQWYGGGDLMFLDAKSDYKFSGGLIDSYNRKKLHYRGVGISPLLGLNVNIFNNVRFSMESGIDIMATRYWGFRQANNPSNWKEIVTTPISGNNLMVRINPIYSLNVAVVW